ncbi:MAG: carbohydrate binding family 9 domain-containing protein [candidate division KSB1 bacterium]|nr:carbohydrate binding family 9 domain-containing protein [candidate division KSB1 bacterium]
MLRISGTVFLINAALMLTAAQSETFFPFRTTVPPVIDGRIEEELWRQSVITPNFLIIEPTFGDTLRQKTVICLAYDDQNLYFAFRCLDEEPAKIKTSIVQRDRMFADDWVGVFLDALGNRQSAYLLVVNPDGIQGDQLHNGDNGDTAPDWVWYSAGNVTDEGYTVEMAVPLRSIRYTDGDHSLMNVIFVRYLSRFGQTAVYPGLQPGQSPLAAGIELVYEGLHSPPQVELLPSFTYSSRAERATCKSIAAAEAHKDFGLSAKYSLTSSITLEATFNPDFSQVESDAYQVEVNQRYPIFYEEKRPFFMEAGGLFNIAATGEDNNMTSAVHTRRIVDPNWGGRLTGSRGRSSFGLLVAEDASAKHIEQNEDKAVIGAKNAYFTVARWKYGLGGDNYIGALYSGREWGNRYNRVTGMDMIYRCRDRHNFSGSLLASESLSERKESGNAVLINYLYGTKKLGLWSALERYDPHFHMETAFYQRTGFERFSLYVGPNFYPDAAKYPVLKRVNPFIFAYLLHDLKTQRDDRLVVFSLRSFWTRQGMLRLDYRYMDEFWQSKTFHRRSGRIMGRVQAVNWLSLFANAGFGKSVYYDKVDPYLGNFSSAYLQVTWQPSAKLTQSADFYHETFRKTAAGPIVYDVDIFNIRTTYQFNKYFFLRAILRWQDYDKKLLTDFLASFTFIPGTVLHAGYGSLYEQKKLIDEEWVESNGHLREFTRSFFLKASYLWRI